MGLDVSHDAWRGGYGSFHLWRQCIASAYHIPLELMEGFWTPDGPSENLIKFKMKGEDYFERKYVAVLPLKWEAFAAPDSVKALLFHSDCDGDIDSKTAGELAEELLKVLPKVKSLFPRWTDGEVRDLTQKFASGCAEAWEANEPLLFR